MTTRRARTTERLRYGALASFPCLILLLSSAAAAQGGSGFTDDERTALEEGELIRRVLRRREGDARAFGGVSFLRIEASVEEVWNAARDPDSLVAVIPTLESARVVEESGGERLVFMHHSYGVGETDYYLRFTLDDARRELSFEIDGSRPHDVRSGRGFMRLTPHRGGTIVSWGMRMDPGVGILGELFSSMLDAWLLKPPLCLRDVVVPGAEPSC